MLRILLPLLLLLLVGCDKEISRERKESFQEIRNVSCTYNAPGMCMDCGMGFDGKFDCRMKFKPFCSHHGSKKIKATVTPVIIHYQSGEVKEVEEVVELEQLSSCI